MTQSKSRRSETLSGAFVGTYVSNDIEERAWVEISLAEVEVFRQKAEYGLNWIGQRDAIRAVFQEFAKEFAMNIRAGMNRSAG